MRFSLPTVNRKMAAPVPAAEIAQPPKIVCALSSAVGKRRGPGGAETSFSIVDFFLSFSLKKEHFAVVFGCFPVCDEEAAIAR